MRVANRWATGLLLAVAPAFAMGGINSWTSLGPEGGDVRKIVRHPTSPNVLYLSSPSGFYRSTDAGASWQLVKDDYQPYPTDIEVDSAHPNRVFVAGNAQPSSLLVSEDAGATLNPVPNFLPAYVYEIEISPDGNTIYTVGGDGGARSTDGGATWDWCGRTMPNIYPAVLSISGSNPEIVYAARASQLFVSTDSCDTWSPLALPADTQWIGDIEVSPTDPQRVWMINNRGLEVSSNGGTSWVTNDSSYTSALEFDPVYPTVLYAAGDAQVRVSDDEGQSWTTLNSGSPVGGILTIAVSHSQLLVGGYSGVALSTANHTAWERRNTGLIGLPISSFSAVAQSDRIYMASWNEPIYFIEGASSSVDALPQHPTTNGGPILLAQPGSSADRLLAPYGATQLGVSTDAGLTWQPIGTKPFHLSTLQSWSSSPQMILGGAYLDMYRSENGGADWELVSGLPANTSSTAATTASESEGIAYTAPIDSGGPNGFGVYKTLDYGANWIPANTGIETVQVRALATDPVAGEIVYGMTDDGPIRSTDAGESWSSLEWPALNSDDMPLVVAVDPARPRTVYAASRYTVVRSIDAGASWELLRQNAAPEWMPLAIVADSVRSGSILLATNSSGVKRFDVQPDLSMEADGPARVAIGGVAQLTFTALNLGPHHATTPRVVVQLPATASNIAVASPQGTCSVASAVATCTYDALRAGFSHAISVSFTPQEGEIELSATISGDQSDAATANNTATIELQATAISDLAASITAPASATAGQNFSYSVSVTNAGPNEAQDVEVAVQLANGIALVSATSNDGTCSSNAGSVTCLRESLPANESMSVAITVSAAAAASYAAIVSVSSQSFDEEAANNSATASTVVSAAPTPQPSGSGGGNAGGGGGGGGGASSIPFLFVLLMIARQMRRNPVYRQGKRSDGKEV